MYSHMRADFLHAGFIVLHDTGHEVDFADPHYKESRTESHELQSH